MKFQSAMEYLTTYGWAILVIAVVLVALVKLNLFNSNYWSPKLQSGVCSVIAGTYGGSQLTGNCGPGIPQFVTSFNGAFTSFISLPITINTMQSGAFSTSVWINPVQYASSWRVCSISNENYLVSGFRFGIDTVGHFMFWTAQSGGTLTLTSSTKANLGQWYDVVVTYNNQNAVLFLNGVNVGTATGNYIGNANPIKINANVGCDPFSAMVANFQVYNTSLSANVVQAMYVEGIGGPPINLPNLVGWWPLNGDANDYSGNANNGAPTSLTYTSDWYSNYMQP